MSGFRRSAVLVLAGLSVQACTGSEPSLTADDRRATEATLQAAMAALSDAVQDGRPPLVVSDRTLQRLGVNLPLDVSVGASERTGRGPATTYRLCLLHTNGYWVASSYPAYEEDSGDGDRCGITVGAASPAPD